MTVSVPGTLLFSDNGDGITTAFSYTNFVHEAADLVVVLEDADGVRTVQVLGADYTLSGVGTANVTVTFGTAPAAGTKVHRFRDTAKKQTVDLQDSARNPAETTEAQLDRFARISQDIGLQVSRSMQRPVGAVPFAGDRWLKTDASGNVVDGGDASEIANAEGYALDAIAAKDAAVVAQGAAEDAQSDAEAAQLAAENAQTASENARDTALGAQTAAETAQGLAETAQLAAEDAQSAAEGAASDSEDARDIALGAKEDAETAASTAVGASNDAQEAAQTAADYVNNLPVLGTAAQKDEEDFATAAQGATADTAMQPGAFGLGGVTSVPDDGDDEAVISFIRFGVNTPNGPGFGAVAINMVDAGGRRFQIAYEIGFTANPRIAARERNTSGSWTAWRSDVSGADKATVAYVDALVSGQGKTVDPVAVMVTTNVTKSGVQNFDGVTGSAGMAYLQNVPGGHASNGIWVMAAGSHTRRADSDTWDEIRSKRVRVNGGTYEGYIFSNNNDAGGTLNTTAITYAESGRDTVLEGRDGVEVAGNFVQLQAGALALLNGATQATANLADLDDKPSAVRNLGVSYPTLAYGATGAGGDTDKNGLTALLDDTATQLPRLQRWAQGTIRMSELIPGSDLEPCADYINLVWRHAGLEAALRGAAFVFDKSRAWWMGSSRSATYIHGNSAGYFIPPRDATIEWERLWEFQDWPLASSPSFIVRSASMGPAAAVAHNVTASTRTWTTTTPHGFARGDRIRCIATTNLNAQAGSWTHGRGGESGWSTARAEDHIVHSVQSATQFTTFDYAVDFYHQTLANPVVQKYVDEPRLRFINPLMLGPGRPVGSTGGGDRAIRVVGGRNLLIEGGRIEDFGGAFIGIGSIMGGSVRDLECRGTLDSVELGQAIARGIFYGGAMTDFVFDNVHVHGGGQAFMHSGLGGLDTSWAELGISRRVKHRDCVAYGPGLGCFTQHMTGEEIEYERCHAIGGPNTQSAFDIRTPKGLISKCVVRDLPTGTAVSFRLHINGFKADGMKISNVRNGIRLTTFDGDNSYVAPPSDIEITNNNIRNVGATGGSNGAIRCNYDLQDGGSYADLGSLKIEDNVVDSASTTVAIETVGKWDKPMVRRNRILDGGEGRGIRVYGGSAGVSNGPRSPVVTDNVQGAARALPQASHASGTVTNERNIAV